MIPFDRDASTADALLTDLYLDAILAGRPFRGDIAGEAGAGRAERQGSAGPGSSAAPSATGRLDPAIRAVSDRLRHDLVRVHPSFRFEERLATRLAEAAVQLRIPTAVGAEGHVVPFRVPPLGAIGATPGSGAGDPGIVDDLLEGSPDGDRRDLSRPLLIGGALTSAALSLAGAALVAWRRTRPGSPMARAARAIRTASSTTARRRSLRGPRRSSATPSARGFD